MLDAQQVAERRTGIGGSDAAAVCGLSPWKTPLDVYLEKRDGVADENPAPWLYWGGRLEDVVAEEYSKRTGRAVRRVNKMLRRTDHPFMIAHIDRQVLDGERILECKTARDSRGWGEEGSDDIPLHYLTQCLHYMIVAKRERCDLAVFFYLDRDYRIYEIGYDPELADRLVTIEGEFWRRVEEDDPPPVTNPADARKLFPDHTPDTTVEASAEVWASVNRLRTIRIEQDELEAERRRNETVIMSWMGDASCLHDLSGNRLATWTTQTARRFNARAFKLDHPELYEEYRKPATTRVFRLKGEA